MTLKAKSPKTCPYPKDRVIFVTTPTPSPRYQELIAQYRQAHERGLTYNGKHDTFVFPGNSLRPHILPLKKLLSDVQARTLLDYGCGKASLHRAESVEIDGTSVGALKDFWALDSVSLYDPGVAAYDRLAAGPFDAVICTDVLEHVDEADVDFVLDQIFSRATRLVYMNISTRPAVKTLPNGENAHATVRPADWWKPRVQKAAAHSPAAYYCAFELSGADLEILQRGCAV